MNSAYKLLHFMLPVGKSKNYCHSYEFRQIICPLNKPKVRCTSWAKQFDRDRNNFCPASNP